MVQSGDETARRGNEKTTPPATKRRRHANSKATVCGFKGRGGVVARCANHRHPLTCLKYVFGSKSISVNLNLSSPKY